MLFLILESGEDITRSRDGNSWPGLSLACEEHSRQVSRSTYPDIKFERTLMYLTVRSSTMMAKRLVLTPNPLSVRSRSRPRVFDHAA